MLTVLQLGLTNAIVASLIASASWLVARWLRAPALAHLLCVVALLKLVALPALVLSIHWPRSDAIWAPPMWVLVALGTVWMAGSAFWFLSQLRIALRFREALACARVVPANVTHQTLRAARRLRLRRCPAVRTLSGIKSPLLYGCWRPTILLPEGLLTELDQRQLQVVIAHELAHYRRGDHWVRAIELVSIGIVWWNPLVWWIRFQIEQTQEECCDRLAAGRHATGRQRYARTLLQVAEDSAPTPPTRASFPLNSSGARQALQQRLTNLLAPRGHYTLSAAGRVGILIAGGACLLTGFRVEPSAQEIALNPPFSDNLMGVSAAVGTQVERPWGVMTSRDGSFQIIVDSNHHCSLLRANNRQPITLGTSPLMCLVLDIGGRYAYSGDKRGIITKWDTSTGYSVDEHEVGATAIQSLDVNDRQQLIAGDQAGTVVLLKTAELQAINRWSLGGSVRCVRFDDSGRHVAVATDSWPYPHGRVCILDCGSDAPLHEWSIPQTIGAVRFADARTLLVADWAGTVDLRLMNAGHFVGRFLMRKDAVSHEAFSPDARNWSRLQPPVPIERERFVSE